MAEKMTRAELVEAFREVGFDETTASRGANLMLSPQYFGFEDVATSLMTAGGEIGRNYAAEHFMRGRVTEVARRVDGGWLKAREARLAEARTADADRKGRATPAPASATFVDGQAHRCFRGRDRYRVGRHCRRCAFFRTPALSAQSSSAAKMRSARPHQDAADAMGVWYSPIRQGRGPDG